VSAHEVIHVVHASGDSGLILKLDYEKAYDRVNISGWNPGALVKLLENG
jgi:hypothetical protein